MTHGLAPPTLAHETHPIVVASVSAFSGAAAVLVLVYVTIAVLSIIAAVKVVTKAGYSGWWVLIALVPIVGFVMALVFAFSDWPVLREVRALRAQVSSSSGYGWPPGHGGGAAAQSGPAAPGMPPPGWYPTPDGRQRYWDGHAWTDRLA